MVTVPARLPMPSPLLLTTLLLMLSSPGRHEGGHADTDLEISGDHRPVDDDAAVVADEDTDIVAVLDTHVVERSVDSLPRDGRSDGDAVLPGVPHRGVGDVELTAGRALVGNAARGAGEIAVDRAVLDDDHVGGDHRTAGNPDAVYAGVDAVEIDVAQAHGLAHVGGIEAVERDVHTVGAGVEDRGEHLVTVDGDRLGEVTAPKPPGSRQLISPLTWVLE